MREPVSNLRLAVLAMLAVGLGSCVGGRKQVVAESPHPDPPTIVLSHPSLPAEQLGIDTGRDLGPLHNVLRVTPHLFSGDSPECDAAFAELQALGVKTIISVDGAKPLADRAQAYGIRYVHIPVGYDGIDVQQQVLIAKAYRDLDGPMYIHCHHGKHRGPAAAASAAVISGELTPEQGVAYLRAAQTSPSYAGLYACVLSISPEYLNLLDDAMPADQLPAVATVSGLVDHMVGVDFCYVNLEDIQHAGWIVPVEHPDLVPVAEAARLADHFRVLMDDAACRAEPEEFHTLLKRSWDEAQALEDAIAARALPAELDVLFGVVGQSCKDCHGTYRNKKSVK